MLRDALGALAFQLALVMIPVVLVGTPLLAWFHFVRRRAPWATPARAGLSAALAALPPLLLAIGWSFLHDRSSTAPIALYAAPLLAALAAAVVFLLTWSLVGLARPGSRRLRLGRLALALVVLAAAGGALETAALRQRALRRAADPATPATALAALASRARKDVALSTALARNPGTPPAILERLAADEAPAVAATAAANPLTPQAALRRLATAAAPEVRLALARNPQATPELLDRLLEISAGPAREAADVRVAVASHRETSGAARARLAGDAEERVRLAVAASRATPAPILAGMAHDPSAEIRLSLATNPNTPRAALAGLAQDPDGKVRHYAAQALAERRDGGGG